MGDEEHGHGVAPMIYRIACVLARANGLYDDGEPEHWANFTRDATLVLEALLDPPKAIVSIGAERLAEIEDHSFTFQASEAWRAMIEAASLPLGPDGLPLVAN